MEKRTLVLIAAVFIVGVIALLAIQGVSADVCNVVNPAGCIDNAVFP